MEDDRKKLKETDLDDDSNSCSICLSAWTSHGEHQLCSLRCGHFYGYSCIIRALNMQNRNNRQCPLCNQKAKESEIRLHYAVSKFSTRDVSKEEELRSQFVQEKAARIESELQAAKLKTKLESVTRDVESLRTELAKAYSSQGVPSENKSHGDNIVRQKVYNISMNKSRCGIWVSNDRGAAIACYTNGRYKLVLVHPEISERPSAAHGGEGHTLPIRDAAVQLSDAVCYGGTIAVGSMDGIVSLVSVANLNEVCRFKVGEPIFSVLFSPSVHLFVGTVKGRIFVLDPRDPRSVPSRLATDLGEPVHALVAISSEAICAATFTRLVVVQIDGQVFPIVGLPERAAGEQYSSVVSAGSNRIAVSVRSSATSYVIGGSIDFAQHSYVFRPQRQYQGLHGKPSGKIAWLEDERIFVPDEASKKCIEYPSGKQLGSGGSLLGGACSCGDYLLLLGQDQAQFVQL